MASLSDFMEPSNKQKQMSKANKKKPKQDSFEAICMKYDRSDF